jgi:hypothetical protein
MSDRIRSVGDNVILNIDRSMIAEALGHSPAPPGEPMSGTFRGESELDYGTPSSPSFEPPQY